MYHTAPVETVFVRGDRSHDYNFTIATVVRVNVLNIEKQRGASFCIGMSFLHGLLLLQNPKHAVVGDRFTTG